MERIIWFCCGCKRWHVFKKATMCVALPPKRSGLYCDRYWNDTDLMCRIGVADKGVGL